MAPVKDARQSRKSAAGLWIPVDLLNARKTKRGGRVSGEYRHRCGPMDTDGTNFLSVFI
jgi:hypothetical protein